MGIYRRLRKGSTHLTNAELTKLYDNLPEETAYKKSELALIFGYTNSMNCLYRLEGIGCLFYEDNNKVYKFNKIGWD